MSNPERIAVGERVTIYPRGKKNIWCADFWQDGHHCRQSLRTTNKREAMRRAVQLGAQLTAGTYQPPPPAVAFLEASGDYLSHLETERRARKTLVKYKGILTSLVDFLAEQGLTRLTQFTAVHFDRFRAARRQEVHRKTLYTEGVVVKQFFRWCKSRKLIPENPIAEFKLNKPLLEPKGGPGLDQVNRILATLEEPDRTPVAVLAFSGLRSGELQRLRVEDLDLVGNWLHIRSREGLETKTGQSRKVPIHPRLRPLLEALPKRRRLWLFVQCSGKWDAEAGPPLNVKKLNERFLAVLAALEMPAGRANGFTLHSLRHFFETYTVNERIPQRVVDAWLGHHGDKSMAAIYYKLQDEDSQRFMKQVPFGTRMPAADVGHSEGRK
jgi:integrase